MGTKPPSGPQPTSTTRAGAAGSEPRTNGQFAASQRSSEVMLIDPTPHTRTATVRFNPSRSLSGRFAAVGREQQMGHHECVRVGQVLADCLVEPGEFALIG